MKNIINTFNSIEVRKNEHELPVNVDNEEEDRFEINHLNSLCIEEGPAISVHIVFEDKSVFDIQTDLGILVGRGDRFSNDIIELSIYNGQKLTFMSNFESFFIKKV